MRCLFFILFLSGQTFAQEKVSVNGILGYSLAAKITEEGSGGSVSYSAEANTSGAIIGGLSLSKMIRPDIEIEVGLLGEQTREITDGTVSINGSSTAFTLTTKPKVFLASLFVSGRYDLGHGFFAVGSLSYVSINVKDSVYILENPIAPILGAGYRIREKTSVELGYRVLKASGSTAVNGTVFDIDMDLSGLVMSIKHGF